MKSNKQFMIMSAIGIIMVVDNHSGSSLGLGTSFFPYNSFFMPMFMFISGYFISQKRCMDEPFKYIGKKFKMLFLPYFGWLLYYTICAFLLRTFTPAKIGHDMSILEFIKRAFLNGEIVSGLNAPGYFVLILFYVSVIMILLRRLFGRFWNEYFMTLVFVLIGTFVVRYSLLNTHDFAKITVFNLAMKVAISLQFFQLGALYKEKLGSWVSKINIVVVVLGTFSIIRIVQHILGDTRWALNRLVFNEELLNVKYNFGYILPFVVSMMGIILWAKIASFLVPVLENSRVCNFISNHTFGIMMHHISAMTFLNFVFIAVNKIKVIPGLDISKALSSSWYRYSWDGNYSFGFFYFLIGIIGACIVCCVVDHLKLSLKRLFLGALHNNIPINTRR